MKLPKISALCAQDDLRPNLCHVFITKDKVVATDGCALIEHNRSILDCIYGLPEECYVHRSHFEEFAKEFEKAWYVKSENIVLLTDKRGKKRVVDVIVGDNMNNIGTFPNYKDIIPDLTKECFNMSFNAELLLTLHKAMVIDYKKEPITLSSTGDSKPILATCKGFDGRALIMPIRLK